MLRNYIDTVVDTILSNLISLNLYTKYYLLFLKLEKYFSVFILQFLCVHHLTIYAERVAICRLLDRLHSYAIRTDAHHFIVSVYT